MGQNAKPINARFVKIAPKTNGSFQGGNRFQSLIVPN